MSDDEISNEEDVNLGHYEGGRNDEEQRHGFGKAYFPNGDSYEGNYENGKRHGKGVYRFNDGALYDGSYFANKRDGHGVFIYPDGSKYEGNWSENTRNGSGTYYYVNGDVYEGEWFRNKKNGYGVYLNKEKGARTEGSWHNGKLNGMATITLGAHIFEGTYQNNLIKGAGRFIFPSKGIAVIGRYKVIEKEEELIPEEGDSRVTYASVWETLSMQPIGEQHVSNI